MIQKIVNDIKLQLDLAIGKNPKVFGYLIDQMMLPVIDARKIAYNIVILKTETPKDFDTIIFIRNMVGIEPNDTEAVCRQKLYQHYGKDETGLNAEFKEQGFTVADVVDNQSNIVTTVAEVAVNAILKYWETFINKKVCALEQYIPHADKVAFMLQSLCRQLNVRDSIIDKTHYYINNFLVEDATNAIADFASMTLNNFVSTIGSAYMDKKNLAEVERRAELYNIDIKLQPESVSANNKPIPIAEALKAFDDATDVVGVTMETLKKLPFWDNFQRWEKRLFIGLLYAADISHCDPTANKAIGEIIRENNNIYTK